MGGVVEVEDWGKIGGRQKARAGRALRLLDLDTNEVGASSEAGDQSDAPGHEIESIVARHGRIIDGEVVEFTFPVKVGDTWFDAGVGVEAFEELVESFSIVDVALAEINQFQIGDVDRDEIEPIEVDAFRGRLGIDQIGQIWYTGRELRELERFAALGATTHVWFQQLEGLRIIQRRQLETWQSDGFLREVDEPRGASDQRHEIAAQDSVASAVNNQGGVGSVEGVGHGKPFSWVNSR